MRKSTSKPSRGRPADRVKTDLSFEEAVKRSLAKPKPPGGWPHAPKPARKTTTRRKSPPRRAT